MGELLLGLFCFTDDPVDVESFDQICEWDSGVEPLDRALPLFAGEAARGRVRGKLRNLVSPLLRGQTNALGPGLSARAELKDPAATGHLDSSYRKLKGTSVPGGGSAS